MMHRVVRVIGRPDLARVSSLADSRGWLMIVLLWSRDIERWPEYLLESA
jgi:hypothetical protein